jgi:VWFA-related protein
MAVDTSASMQPRMDEARKAGSQFFASVLKKGDRAFLVSFDTQPQLIQRWSPKLSDVNAGLAKLRAEEATALYDAVVYSLYNFVGVKGQKALVLITDGKDTASKFSFEQALEYARRAAVPIYAIGIGRSRRPLQTRQVLQRDRRQRVLHRDCDGAGPDLHRHPKRAPLAIHPRLLSRGHRETGIEVARGIRAGQRRAREDDSGILSVK